MKSLLPIRLFYVVASAYDGLLGLAFLVFAARIYSHFGITPPNHWGYIHFPAGVLMIFGLMFLMIALHPIENRNLITYGILLKLCYAGTVGWHWYYGGIPTMWKYFAFADLVFAVLFFWSMVRLEAAATEAAATK